jgi:hypothetical protein
MADTIDESAAETPGVDPVGATPEDTTAITPAAEAPTMAQAAAAPPVVPTAAGSKQSWFRKRWVLITGAAAVAVVLLLGGVAIGTTIDGHGGRGGHRGADGPGYGPQADGQGHGGFDRDGDGGFGQGGGQSGGQFGQPRHAAASGRSPGSERDASSTMTATFSRPSGPRGAAEPVLGSRHA